MKDRWKMRMNEDILIDLIEKQNWDHRLFSKNQIYKNKNFVVLKFYFNDVIRWEPTTLIFILYKPPSIIFLLQNIHPNALIQTNFIFTEKQNINEIFVILQFKTNKISNLSASYRNLTKANDKTRSFVGSAVDRGDFLLIRFEMIFSNNERFSRRAEFDGIYLFQAQKKTNKHHSFPIIKFLPCFIRFETFNFPPQMWII